mmetsp:Transcript_16298/g.37453  ORF Transcript_16298/g.37453 Transcript_16298/m.37453 type:complete len:178 (+) Transcript_16298:257-790(+)
MQKSTFVKQSTSRFERRWYRMGYGPPRGSRNISWNLPWPLYRPVNTFWNCWKHGNKIHVNKHRKGETQQRNTLVLARERFWRQHDRVDCIHTTHSKHALQPSKKVPTGDLTLADYRPVHLSSSLHGSSTRHLLSGALQTSNLHHTVNNVIANFSFLGGDRRVCKCWHMRGMPFHPQS